MNFDLISGFRKPLFDMDGLTSCCIGRFFHPCRKNFISRRPSFLVMASHDDSKLDEWDKMELKFGRLLGEDPKLTIAKIMGRKANPNVSYLEIEKSFRKKKGSLNEEIVYVPFDVGKERPPSSPLNSLVLSCKPTQREKKLNLVRPIMKEQPKTELTDEKPLAAETKANRSQGKIDSKDVVSNVILRKPSSFQVFDFDIEQPSKLKIKPNLSLKMRKEPKLSNQNVSDIILLKKPEPTRTLDPNQQNSSTGSDSLELSTTSSNAMIEEVKLSYDLQRDRLESSEIECMVDLAKRDLHGPTKYDDKFSSEISELGDELKTANYQSVDRPLDNEHAATQPSDMSLLYSTSSISAQAALQGKPQRLDPSTKGRPYRCGEEIADLDDGSNNHVEKSKHSVPAALEEHEDGDWTLAEALLQSGEREEVELISCSSRGFVVSFGSLIGFLPYRNLGARWKFLALESWLRKKGVDPSLHRHNLSIIGSHEVQNKKLAPDSNQNPEMGKGVEEKLSPNMELENLLETYDQEKTKFLSSFIGQRIKVNVIMADRKSRRLMFSGKPKEKEEAVEKKRSLMAKLSIGDVVKCCIKKITYFGIFVEIEGVPALIHQSEVSWDATLDPSSFFKVGQIVEAKIHQLDFSLERITLSLKQITPDPLMETLESVIASCDSLSGSLEAGQTDVEWSDVEMLIKELEQIDGIQNVSKGRFFLSPSLAPTFQVYMASMFDNQYKLLARSENKVQEVIVQASLDNDQMKSAILTCTGKIE